MIKSSEVWWFLIMFVAYLVVSSTLAGCVTTETSTDKFHKEFK